MDRMTLGSLIERASVGPWVAERNGDELRGEGDLRSPERNRVPGIHTNMWNPQGLEVEKTEGPLQAGCKDHIEDREESKKLPT